MRSWIFGVVTLACLTFGASTAIACPVGGGEQSVRPTRPVQNVQTVSFQASELNERANRLESAAISHDQSARSLEQEADSLLNRARVLRNQASLVNASDRESILDIADELQVRASSDRTQAAQDRNTAAQFRVEASSLRTRAVQLVRLNNGGGGGGGWKGRGPVTRSTSLPTEGSGINL